MANDKTIISVQLPDFVLEYLKEKAKEECTSVSYLIRKLIIEDINKRESK